MVLEYHIRTNPFSDDNNFLAVSNHTVIYTLEDIIRKVTREGSPITTAEALGNQEEINRQIIAFLKEGNAVITPLVKYVPTLKGTFDAEGNPLDPADYKVVINTLARKRLRAAADEIKPRRIAPKKRLPKPDRFFDYTTESQNKIITPGEGACIRGDLLSFDKEDENQGIFFINTDNREVTRVNGSILKNKPAELIFITPELPSGTYRLEVRSMLHNTSIIRTGSLSNSLVVSSEST